MSGADAKIYRTPLAEDLAGRRGCTSTENPYEDDNLEARAWIRGLLEGRTKRLTVIHGARGQT